MVNPSPRRARLIPITRNGAAFIFMTFFMGAAALNSQANLLFGVFGLMIGVYLVSGIISRRILRHLKVTRSIPEHGVVGRPLTIAYSFQNRKRFWPSLSVMLCELDGVDAFMRHPCAYLLHVAPGEEAKVQTEVIPQRRGVHSLNRYELSSSFPFGFTMRCVNGQYHENLLVYPAIGKVDKRLIERFRSAESGGAKMRPQRGGYDEFYGVKEYRRGESTRMIYWRRSASRGTLVSKEMTRVSPPRIMLVVDTMQREVTAASSEAVERAIAMAASIADHALEEGLLVGLASYSGQAEPIILKPNRGKRHRREILTILAQLPVNRGHDSNRLISSAMSSLQPSTTIVLLTPKHFAPTLAEASRNSVITISATSRESLAYFTFDKVVDFQKCCPVSEGEDRK